ncbi:protein of unknown function [Methylocaldum szegediense]|uniref:ATPase AAA-type core domain-containing protein n=1 Tax=Methylocaldum szegediense TaxID=73780 RepID=A0ABN8X4F6_9GAMM|nr:protein of unknown function [Methylocaldum szegediense]
MKVTPEFSAHLKFGLNEYRFSLRAAADRSLFFSHESAPFHGPLYGYTVNDQGSGHVESALMRKPVRSASEQWVVDTIQGWRVYHFHDTSPSSPVMGVCNVVDSDVLHSDASNIAAFLMHMARPHPDHYARIEETVRQVAPFFGAFVLREISPGQTQLLWKDRYSDLIYYPYQLSDGTIRYICLATLLLQPELPATVIVDEPELGLHPYAIKLLASMMHEAAQHTQLIVSTQSSLLIDEMSPEDVIVANQRDGETVLDRLDSESLGEWLQEYTLDQLWEKNNLGGAALMTWRRLYITVEGETERTFAEAVLRPHLTQYSLDVRPLVVITNRKLGTRGGVLDFATIRDDLRRMMRQDGNHDALFTTMVDLYALPADFP